MSDDFDPYDEEFFRDIAADEVCPMCKGTGQINALTDQDIIFVASYADCPACDGLGRL